MVSIFFKTLNESKMFPLNYFLICALLGHAIATKQTIKLQMPVVETQTSDQYVCYATSLDSIDDSYVLSALTEADPSVVHHVATGVCEDPIVKEEPWTCTSSQGRNCKGKAINFGGWDEFTKDNGIFKLPDGVALKVGNETALKYFIFEIHFREPVKNPISPAANVTLTFTRSPQKFQYQTYTLLNSGYIPPHTEKGFFSDMACVWKRPSVYAYRYFLHTHHYGLLAEGFLIRNGTWTLLGAQLSKGKAKDLFDIPGGPMEIKTGDIIAARCLYVNKGDKPVYFGMSEEEEMCNIQFDIGYRAEHAEHFGRPPACTAPSPDFNFCDHYQTKSIC